VKKYYYFGLIILFLFSCQQKVKNYKVVVVDEEGLNTDFTEEIDDAGRALLQGYLYAYGNECNGKSQKNKCAI